MAEIDFKYDVFISYSHKDEDWVVGTLLPTLENASLKVCIDFRDFEPGKPSRHNMRDACKQSVYTVLVMTPAWMASEWTSFESLLAFLNDPAGQHQRTIPILLENCDIPEDIQIFTYIDFLRKDREGLAWQQLFKAIGKSKLDTFTSGILSAHAPPKQDKLHNLPPRNEFIGRKDEKSEGIRALLSRSYIISIEGIGGVGKTALALEIAHESLAMSKESNSLNRAFKGFVWVGAKDQGVTLDNILDEIAQTLENIFIMKQRIEEKQKSIVKLLQDKPILLIIDGFENITDDSVRVFLLNSIPEPSKVLLTTRTQKIESRSILLKGLPDSDAVDLIKSHGQALGLTGIENVDDKILLRLCKATGGLPLAIKWALGQIKRKGQSLDSILDFLYRAKGDIFDQIFSRSWNLLSPNIEPTDAQYILHAMTIFVNDSSQESIAAASGIPLGFAFDEALGQLVEMSLVDTTDNLDISCRRYNLHPLTRVYASEKFKNNTKVTREAKERLAFFFEELTQKHGGLWNLIGFEKLKPDISNIISMIQWCWKEDAFIELGINIFDNIRYFIVNYGLWNTALELAHEAIALFPLDIQDIPEHLTVWQTKVVIFRIWPIAWIYRFRGDYDSAEKEINFALVILQNVGDDSSVAMAKRHLGLVLQKAGRTEKAETFFKEALEYAKSKKDVYRVQLLNADLADLALQQGNLDKAKELSEVVITCPNQITDRQCIARFYRVLGSVARQEKNIKEAKKLCEKSLEYTEGLQYLDGIADASFELAQIEMEMGQKQKARQKYEQAHMLYKALGMENRAQEIEGIFAQLEENDNAER